MSKREAILGAALATLLLASCGGGEAPATENDTAGGSPNGLDNSSASGPDQSNLAEVPDVESVPPPDAVSHPEGYLPNAGDSPAPPEPEPSGENSTRPRTPPPATEDEYIRNKQTGA